MNTTAQITPPRTPSGPKEPTDAGSSARPPASERRVAGEMLAELVPLVGVIPGYGPPAVFVLVPWLFLGLIVGGPLAWLFALVVVVATVVAALAAAILTAPYLLVRHLRTRRARHAPRSAPAAQVVAIESPRVAT